MKVAIVGSREFPELVAVHRYVKSLDPGTIVVSGGARGVDRAAELAAKQRGLGVETILPAWKVNGVYNPAAGFERNIDIIRAADRVVAFWDGKSRGTVHSIGLAVEQQKPVLVVFPTRMSGCPVSELFQKNWVEFRDFHWTISNTL